MTPLALTDQQLKTVLDVAGFVPRRLRRSFLKNIASELSVDDDVGRAISGALANLDRVESARRGPRLEP